MLLDARDMERIPNLQISALPFICNLCSHETTSSISGTLENYCLWMTVAIREAHCDFSIKLDDCDL